VSGELPEGSSRRTRITDFLRRHPRRAAYLMPTAVSALIVQTWFRPGAFIAGGDLPPFVRNGLAFEITSWWGHSGIGAGTPAAEIARAPEVAALGIVHILGLSDATGQRLFVTLIIAAVALATVFFVFSFVERPVAAGLAGILVVVNPFTLQTRNHFTLCWEMALMALVGGLILRAARGRRVSGVVLALATVPAIYLAVNPADLLMPALWILALASMASILFGSGGAGRAFSLLLRASPWAVGLNVWWVAPFAYSLLSPGIGRQFAAGISISSWAFVHGRASIPNVVSLSSTWGWDFPLYFPFDAALDSPWWAPLRFCLPTLALMAPLVVPFRKRATAVTLTAVTLLVVFLIKGVHPPLASVNTWLYQHIPGMWLLREPFTKLGPILLLTYVALAAMTIQALAPIPRRVGKHLRANTAAGLTAVLVAGALAYPYPLWTASLTGDGKFAASVRLPSEWTTIASEINNSSEPGKVLVLPLDDYYQVPTSWGYNGVDTIPRLLLSRPTIQLLPGGYYNPIPGFAALLNTLQSSLVAGETQVVEPLLRALGVAFVIVRHDIDTSFRGRRVLIPPSGPMDRTLAETPALDLVGRFGVANVYRLREPSGQIQSLSSVVAIAPNSSATEPSVVSVLPPGYASTSGVVMGSLDSADVVGLSGAGGSFSIDKTGRYLAGTLASGLGLYRAWIDDSGATAMLTVQNADSLIVDGLPLARSTLRLPIPSNQPMWLSVNDRVLPLESKAITFTARADSMLAVLGEPRRAQSVLSGLSAVEDCHRYDNRTPEETGLAAYALEGVPPLAVHLEAAAHSACVHADARLSSPGSAYVVHLEARSLEGAAPRFCVWETVPRRCVSYEPLAAGASWKSYSFPFTVQQPPTNLTVYLYADEPAEPAPLTITEYRGVQLIRLKKLGNVPLPANRFSSLLLRAGTHTLGIHDVPPVSLSPFSPARDCNRSDSRSFAEVGISATHLPAQPQPAVRLYAGDHSACVSAKIESPIPGAAYTISFDSRTRAGSPARFCLFDEVTRRCVASERLQEASGWRAYRQTVTTSPATGSLDLFLYADGLPGPRDTETEYRAVRVSLAHPLGVVIPLLPTGSAPAITWRAVSASKFEGTIAAASHPFVLALRESFSPEWELGGLSGARTVQHIQIDGYANGWIVSPGSSFHFTMEFGPDVWGRWARVASALALLVALILVLMRAMGVAPLHGRVDGFARGDNRSASSTP
jgi:arabinofuranan 3-O-arabinosyltransferase